MTGDACPAAGELAELVAGRLDAAGAQAIESHIDGCEACRAGLAAVVRGKARAPAFGRYRVDGVLGAGGMGVVYRGWDTELARAVAIKVVRPGGDDAALRERLAREARTLARVHHPNVCQVHDVGVDRGELWIAMELVAGVTLRAWLGARPSRDASLAVLVAAGRGLAAAHAAGVIHRDVKPDNVIVDADSRAVITDFGLARAEDDPTTRTAVVAGTPAYLAPEQLELGRADARSDQYAFAVMAHEALVGARPRPRGVPAAILPAPVRRVLRRALAEDPDARYATMTALVEALEAAARPRVGRAGYVAAAIVAGAAAIGVIGWAATRTREPVRKPPADTPLVEPAPVETAPAPAMTAVVDPPAPPPKPKADRTRKPPHVASASGSGSGSGSAPLDADGLAKLLAYSIGTGGDCMALIDRGEREHLDRPEGRFLALASQCAGETGVCDRGVAYFLRQMAGAHGAPLTDDERTRFAVSYRDHFPKCRK